MGASILYLDQAYSLADARRRKQTNFIEARTRSGIFSRVLSVHPLVGAMGRRLAGRLNFENFAPGHVVVDGFVEGRRCPSWLIPMNFIQSQFRLVVLLVMLVRRERTDLIYASDCFYLGALGLLLKMLTGRPVMIGIMGNSDLAYETTGALVYPRLLRFRRVEQSLQRWVLKNADWIEVASEDSARYVQRYGADPVKFVHLPVIKFVEGHHFVRPEDRPDAAPALASLGVPGEDRLLICVGRLRPVKYSLDALEAMRIVLNQVPGVTGLFAGEGELRQEIEARVRAWGLTDRILLPGNIDQATLGSILPGSVALSPLTGMALVETSLAGAPPVAYDIEWQPEFVEDGVNGFIVPFRDSRAMGEAALRLIRDPALFERLSTATRASALRFADADAYGRVERKEFNRILKYAKRLP